MDGAPVHGGEEGERGRTVRGVIVAFAFCGYGGGARGCPDTPAVAAPDDDLDIRERTRVDAHDVRALHAR